jgi:hypothetical protein
MVVQVGADPVRRHEHVDAGRLQHLRRTDPGALQDGRRAVDAGGEHHHGTLGLPGLAVADSVHDGPGCRRHHSIDEHLGSLEAQRMEGARLVVPVGADPHPLESVTEQGRDPGVEQFGRPPGVTEGPVVGPGLDQHHVMAPFAKTTGDDAAGRPAAHHDHLGNGIHTRCLPQALRPQLAR